MILHDLRHTGSTLAKKAILKRADTFDKSMFKYAYNPNLMYGLKYNFINWTSVKPFNQLDEIILDKLIAGTLYGNGAREAVNNHCLEHGDLVKLIVSKDLDCGVTATTLNQVFGKGFVPQFKVQLATEVPIRDIKVPCVGQIKYNGVRVIALVDLKTGTVKLKTRNGKEFYYPELVKDILCCNYPSNIEGFILDGELVIGDSRETNHTDVSGPVTSSMRTGNPILHRPFVLTVFDAMTLEEFNSCECDKAYSDRLQLVYNLVDNMNSDIIREVVNYKFENHKDIEETFQRLLSTGYEGLILKHMDHKYTFRRSKDWIKLKDIKTADLKVIDIQEGTGKYAGAIGALICEGEVEGKQVRVNVGSGLSDVQRNSCSFDYIYKTVEVKYNSLIVDRDTQEWSLFLPRFVCVREDK